MVEAPLVRVAPSQVPAPSIITRARRHPSANLCRTARVVLPRAPAAGSRGIPRDAMRRARPHGTRLSPARPASYRRIPRTVHVGRRRGHGVTMRQSMSASCWPAGSSGPFLRRAGVVHRATMHRPRRPGRRGAPSFPVAGRSGSSRSGNGRANPRGGYDRWVREICERGEISSPEGVTGLPVPCSTCEVGSAGSPSTYAERTAGATTIPSRLYARQHAANQEK